MLKNIIFILLICNNLYTLEHNKKFLVPHNISKCVCDTCLITYKIPSIYCTYNNNSRYYTFNSKHDSICIDNICNVNKFLYYYKQCYGIVIQNDLVKAKLWGG